MLEDNSKNRAFRNLIIAEYAKRPPGFDRLDLKWDAAVLIPLIETPEGIKVLFEVRAKSLKRQPGEICFPGGKHEKSDVSYAKTAIRETCEELGLTPEDLELWGEGDALITYRGPVLHPFVGIIKHPEKICFNPAEVEEVFAVPLSFFLENEPKTSYVNLIDRAAPDYPFELVPQRYHGERKLGGYTVYFYLYKNYVIWGLTARMLYAFLQRYKAAIIEEQ